MLGVSATLAAPPNSARDATPVVADQTQTYRFDLERNFFPSADSEVAARADVIRAADEVTTLASELDSPARLVAAFEAEDRMQRLFRKHDLYLFLRYATDIRREGGLAAADELRGKVRAARQTLRRAVSARGRAWITRAIAERPSLARYGYWIDTINREAKHMVAPEQQTVLDAVEPLLGAGDYPQTVNALVFEPVRVDGRMLDVRRDRAEIEASPSPEIRRQGARAVFAGYGTKRDLLAYMLVRAIKGGDAVARLKGHGSAVEEAAFEAYVTPAHFEELLAEVARNGAFYKAWQHRVGDPFASTRRWSLSDAVAAVTVSAAPIGSAYQREFAELLDAENGRADLAGGDNRLPIAGTASVYPIGSSAIYMNAFEGSLLDLIVLAHEGGHAVQAQLMFRANVPMVYAAGPGYFTESFGRFQELLLLDHLHRSATKPEEKRFFRDALAARLLAVFASAEEAAVELAIRRSVGQGKAHTADDLDAVTASAGAPYSVEYERTPERRGLWMVSEGYFMAPLQELNDAYSSLLAVRYFQLYRNDRRGFAASYLALLSNGYAAAPDDLLKRRLGLDMTAPGFASETIAALKTELDALYR